MLLPLPTLVGRRTHLWKLAGSVIVGWCSVFSPLSHAPSAKAVSGVPGQVANLGVGDHVWMTG